MTFTILSILTATSLVFLILKKIELTCFLIVFFSSLAILFIFHRLRLHIFSNLQNELDNLEENTNILEESIESKKRIVLELPKKNEKIYSLFNLSQKFIRLSGSQETYDYIMDVSAELFRMADNIVLFTMEKDKNIISIVRSFKRNDPAIKEKHGEVIDKWALRHNQPILIEDIVRDFRFDYSKVTAFRERSSRSFIICPISAGEKILGIIRAESKSPMAFTLDDSRLLYSICNLAAVVLEKTKFLEDIKELAIRDALTSLFLRDYFLQRLKEEIARAKIKKSQFGIIMLDIDDFKKINDECGHVVGDAALKKLSKILLEATGDSGNTACRFGGEEFLVLIVECDEKKLLYVAEEIRRQTESSIVTFRRKRVEFTVSGGTALYPRDGTEMLQLIDKSDELLYKAKTQGKNRICSA